MDFLNKVYDCGKRGIGLTMSPLRPRHKTEPASNNITQCHSCAKPKTKLQTDFQRVNLIVHSHTHTHTHTVESFRSK